MRRLVTSWSAQGFRNGSDPSPSGSPSCRQSIGFSRFRLRTFDMNLVFSAIRPGRFRPVAVIEAIFGAILRLVLFVRAQLRDFRRNGEAHTAPSRGSFPSAAHDATAFVLPAWRDLGWPLESAAVENTDARPVSCGERARESWARALNPS